MIFKANGKLVIHGLFGVSKAKDVPGQPGVSQLRLICNLVPTNSYFGVIRGQVEELPYIMQLTSICLLEDEVLLISQEDTSCAFICSV